MNRAITNVILPRFSFEQIAIGDFFCVGFIQHVSTRSRLPIEKVTSLDASANPSFYRCVSIYEKISSTSFEVILSDFNPSAVDTIRRSNFPNFLVYSKIQNLDYEHLLPTQRSSSDRPFAL
jgi:hypothetical protein